MEVFINPQHRPNQLPWMLLQKAFKEAAHFFNKKFLESDYIIIRDQKGLQMRRFEEALTFSRLYSTACQTPEFYVQTINDETILSKRDLIANQ